MRPPAAPVQSRTSRTAPPRHGPSIILFGLTGALDATPSPYLVSMEGAWSYVICDSRPIRGAPPMIDLEYNDSNTSPLLKFLLSKREDQKFRIHRFIPHRPLKAVESNYGGSPGGRMGRLQGFG
jgi:hypothetical protein